MVKGKFKTPEAELFHESVMHVRKNGRPSVSGMSCVYGGCGCALRPLFRDRESAEKADAMVLHARHLLSGQYQHLVKYKYQSVDADFACSLQKCHDSSAIIYGDLFMPLFEDSARLLAEIYTEKYGTVYHEPVENK